MIELVLVHSLLLYIIQICKNVIKAAVEGEKKLNKQVNTVAKKSEPSVIKHNWVHERPRITWDFYNEPNVTPCQSKDHYLINIQNYN